jgi:UDP-3-O-[3-hydroxymyristoyl] glucosamine N-acyltransferase
MRGDTNIHPSAQVAPDAKIGDRVRIWQNCIVMGGAQIGDGFPPTSSSRAALALAET